MYSAPIYVVYLCTPSTAELHGGVLHGAVTDIDQKLSSDESPLSPCSSVWAGHLLGRESVATWIQVLPGLQPRWQAVTRSRRRNGLWLASPRCRRHAEQVADNNGEAKLAQEGRVDAGLIILYTAATKVHGPRAAPLAQKTGVPGTENGGAWHRKRRVLSKTALSEVDARRSLHGT